MPAPRRLPADLCRGGGHPPGHRAGPGRGRIGLCRPPVLRRCAGRGRGRQGARLAGLRRDLSALPVADRCGLRGRRRGGDDQVGHLAAAAQRVRPPGAVAGPGTRRPDLVATDHVPDRLAVEKVVPAPPFPQISNGAPGIETLLSVVYSTGVAPGASRWSGWSTCWPPPRRGCSACRRRARWRSVAMPTWCCSIPTRRA